MRKLEPSALTIVAPIKVDQVKPLTEFLAQIGQDIRENGIIDFTRLKTTHFLRWVVIDNNPKYAPLLAFEANLDGTIDAYLDHLITEAGSALESIYSKCEGFPDPALRSAQSIKSYLLKHAIPYEAFYQAYPGYTLEQVRGYNRVRAAIQDILDQKKVSLTQRPELLKKAIEEALAKEGVAIPPPRAPLPSTWQATLARLILESRPVQIIAGILALPFLIPIALVLVISELFDKEAPKKTDETKQQLVEMEDVQIQNQLTHIVEVKFGIFRRLLLQFVLRAIDFLARHYFNKGNLGGIPTIHFARWVLVDKKRLLFFSNYDGSWENYLGDFIDQASEGLTGVWSNTKNFPKTFLLFLFGGSRKEEAFKQWTRDHQIPSQLWYSAHTDESVLNILNNIEICAQLKSPLAGKELTDWLQRL